MEMVGKKTMSKIREEITKILKEDQQET